MAKLTEQEVIQYYQNRKQELAQELSKVEAVLSTLTGEATPAKKRKYIRRAAVTTKKRGRKPKSAAAQSAPEAKPETPAKTKRGKRKTAATKTVKGKTVSAAKTPAKRKPAPKPAPSPSQGYDPKGGWDSKIHYTLSQIGSGKKEDIVQYITDKDPGTAPEKIRKAVGLRLAILLKGGKLKGEQTGDEYRYRLG